MPPVRKITDRQFLHLLKVAAGFLPHTDGDLPAAMSLAMAAHYELLHHIRDHEIRSDLGPGDAILFIPEEGGLALRLERHPKEVETPDPEEISYPDMDLLGFEVVEHDTGTHYTAPRFDATALDEGWDEM